MKKILITLMMLGMSGLIFAGQSVAGSVEHRQALQSKRIWQGIANGQLTRYETRRLLHEQQQIRRLKQISWRDGRLSRKERIRLAFWLDKADRHIFLLKHNRHHRASNWHRTSLYGHRRFW